MDEPINHQAQHRALLELANTKMPFGKYAGKYLVDVPEFYYVWLRQKGFPKGKIGELLASMYEIKVNGLENLIRPLISKR